MKRYLKNLLIPASGVFIGQFVFEVSMLFDTISCNIFLSNGYTTDNDVYICICNEAFLQIVAVPTDSSF